MTVTVPNDGGGGGTHVVTQNDAAVDGATESAAPATVTSTTRVAIRRGQTLELHAVEAKGLAKTASTTLPGDRSRLVAWPRSGSLVVGGNLGTMVGKQARPVLGTITEAGSYTALKPTGVGDVLEVITTSSGEVWLERCQKWGEDNPEEEGCSKLQFVRIAPTSGTGKKRPTQGTPAAVIADAATMKLAVRQIGDDRFVVDCTAGGKTTTLFEQDQVYEAPTWRWLAADPPVAFVRFMPAGSGEGGESADPGSYGLLRACMVKQDAQVRLGPEGLWAERSGSADTGKFDVWRSGQKLATIEADELVFEGGWLPSAQR